jgi:hypothetical protein
MTLNPHTTRYTTSSVQTVKSSIARCNRPRFGLSVQGAASSMLAVLIAGLLAMPMAAMAQSAPDTTFSSTSTAMDGSLTYCGALWNFLGLLGPCSTVAITPANEDSEGASGSSDEVASNLSVYDGSTLIATIGSSNDSATDSDTSSNDSADPAENEQNVSIFNGAVTYAQVQASDDCVSSPPNGTVISVICAVQSAITNLEIEGVPVYPGATQVLNGTQIPLTNFPITVNGVALVLNGTLTIGAEPVTGQGSSGSWGFRPIQITGQACPLESLGCPLGYVNVQINDDLEPYAQSTDPYYSYLAGYSDNPYTWWY